MLTFATRTAARRCITFPVFKDVAATQTTGRSDNQFLSPGAYRASNMQKVFVDLFFPDPYRLREFSGTHLAGD